MLFLTKKNLTGKKMTKEKVDIIEVGPRDGLQSIKEILPISNKKNLIRHLIQCGFEHIEAGSFVRFDKVPAMSGSDEIANELKEYNNNQLWYLAPNLKGLQSALNHGVSQIALFTAVSESFNQKNIGMSVEKSLSVIKSCLDYLKENQYEVITNWNQKPTEAKQIKLRLYISTVIACPYEGFLDPELTSDLLSKIDLDQFCQTSLGDTIGQGTPLTWRKLLQEIDPKLIKENKIAMHCHNTYGMAIASIYEGLNQGVRSFDSSIGGLGGCPFAPGATGNVATEDLIYLLDNLNNF
jgi:hydroxymethylglutaryl-CoA lyase